MEIQKNKKRGEILAERFSSMSFGDALSHQEISEIIGVKNGSGKYTSAIKKARDILREDYQMAIECLRGYGYRVVNPDVYTNYALSHYKRGRKAINTGYKYLNNAPTKHMSPEARDAYRRVYDKAVVVKASMDGMSAEMKVLSKKPHPFQVTKK